MLLKLHPLVFVTLHYNLASVVNGHFLTHTLSTISFDLTKYTYEYPG
jgi:hypothetical protein